MNILFIQGGGDNGYEVDEALVSSLREKLGVNYPIHYPRIASDENSPNFGWTEQIGKEISKMNQDFILAGHSFGASMILKYLSENSVTKNIKGIFLLATPFWNGDEEWQNGLKLKDNFADRLPGKVPVFLYHCIDDEEIPFSQLGHYKKTITSATFRKIKEGGHQFNNALAELATDIRSI
jgi:predicted alpha/beta hydrolase family esterase